MSGKKVELNQIFNGKCEDYLKSIPDNSVDLIVSSPPYNIGKSYEKRAPLDIYLEEQQKIISECYRILKNTGSIFWQVGSYSNKGTIIPLDVKFFPIFENLGMYSINRMVWLRQHGLQAKNKFSCRHETMLWFSKSMDYKFYLDNVRVPQKYQNKKYHKGDKMGQLSCNPDGKNPGDVWSFRNIKHNHEEQTIHPAQFPEDMIKRIILATTEEGDTVFDPFMGVGTVPVVAKSTNRSFLGSEIDSEYFKVANQRLTGLPDENNCFPNLKSLRNYVEKTGECVTKFRFALQKGKTATDRSKAKIYSEQYHLEEYYSRMEYEEQAFICKSEGEDIPVDPKLNGNGKKTATVS
jgi:adenine-specific DNA-methyltransferase